MIFLNNFFQELNKHKVSYCVWGNYEGLPQSLNGSDLDIILHEEDKKLFFNILSQCIEQHQGKLVSYYKTSNSEFIRILSTANSWGLTLDVFYNALHFKGNVLIPTKWITHFTTTHNDILVNDLGFSYLAGFFKELIHNSKVRDKYLLNTKIELQNNSAKYELFISETYGINTFFFLKENINQLHQNEIVQNLRKLILKHLNINYFKILLYEISLLKRLFNKKPGFVVAFLGTDGSGKSTIINKLMESQLKETFHNALYYEHLRPNVIPSIATLLGKGKPTNEINTDPHSNEPSKFFGSLLRWSYYLIDYTFGYFYKVWKRISIHSCVWIFDRYYYDYLIDPKRCRVKLPLWLLKFGAKLVPSPDIIFCLGTDHKIIHQRKPELPINEVERQVFELKTFCKNNKKAIWIDTGKNVETSVQEVLSEVEKTFSNRFKNICFDK